ncbi:stabilizer of axonemal microtubules 4 [Labrus mixtus]|uniref:stabilizer of axonemal microtubules 4 n=1 Tax=Labrus mixtus TaxID=508554 RepID=UPI0029BFC3A3|nr:stabilizer of axonemal microtubules 4 [Labrus mixtus]
MDEQGRIVMPSVAATGSRGQLTSDNNTSYRDFYEASMENFTSHLGHPSSSGFTANNRPAIYYKPSLDLIDNPHMGFMLSDNFTSQTKQHYQPHMQPACSGSLPNLLNRCKESGFHQLTRPPQTAILEEKVEPHRSHSSVMKSDFISPSSLQDNEATPGLCGRSCRESGFTRGAIAPLARDPTSCLPPFKTKSEAPAKKTIGKKEPTGFLSNASNSQAFPKTPFDCSQFTTHYESRFCHPAVYEKFKPGNARAGIMSTKMDNGYNRQGMDRFIFMG